MSAQIQVFGDPPTLARDGGCEPANRGSRGIDIPSHREGDWTVLVHPEPFEGDPLADLRGAPGLWRAVPSAPPVANGEPGPRGWSTVFEIPPGVAHHSEGEGGPQTGDPLTDLYGWAQATTPGGTLPVSVGAPTRDEVESWIEPARRHVRAGAHLAPLELRADGARAGLAVPSLVRLPSELSPGRLAWVRELCCDVHDRWRLVRFGIDDSGVRAEVDLSGAPPESARALFEIALAALTTAAAWVLPALVVVADPRVGSRLLDQPPSRETSRPHTQGAEA